jgi:hypothetical protein
MAPSSGGLPTSVSTTEAARACHGAHLKITVAKARRTSSRTITSHTFIKNIASAAGIATKRAVSSTITADAAEQPANTREPVVLYPRRDSQHTEHHRRPIAGGRKATEGKGRELYLPGRCPAGPAADNAMGGRRILPSVLHALQHGGGEARHTSLCESPTPKVTHGRAFAHAFFCYQNIAATAVFLANKTEENCRKTKDLIIAVAKVAQKNVKLVIDEQSKEYWRWRDSILTYEEVMLEALTFDLCIENPYQRLYEHLNALDMVHNKRFRDSAWAFCNDACLTVLPLLMEARDIAIAAIFFASTVTKCPIPDQQNGEAWWRAVRGDEALMMRAIDLISDFYSENPLRKQAPTPGSPKFDLESTRRKGEDAVYISQNGTPMGTDARSTQSPVAGAGSQAVEEKEPAGGGDATDLNASRGPGDSDSALKAAANDLDVHQGRPNGRDIKSPGNKRKMLGEEEGELEGGRDSKRARTEDPDEDEGEVKSEG